MGISEQTAILHAVMCGDDIVDVWAEQCWGKTVLSDLQ